MASNLPPGCTNADIERAYGSDTIEEAFEAACPELSPKAKAVWETEEGSELVSIALEWAYRAGYQEAKTDEAEAKYYDDAARESDEQKL